MHIIILDKKSIFFQGRKVTSAFFGFRFFVNFAIVESFFVFVLFDLDFPDPDHRFGGFDHLMKEFIFLFEFLASKARLTLIEFFPVYFDRFF